MNEDGYIPIPTADYRPYTELPPEERKQVEDYLKKLSKRRNAAAKVQRMQDNFIDEISCELERE